MNILVKLPTRSRPAAALQIINDYNHMADNRSSIRFVVSCDTDDESMNNAQMIRTLAAYPNVVVVFGQSLSKIHAINRDFQHFGTDYDICVLASDDMHCQVKGWDTILKVEMATHFPDTDGVLWHWDGDPNTRGKLNTMCIMGRKAIDRFGYIYNPEYTSLWCDNEFTEVWSALGKQFYSDDILFRHVHFSNTTGLQPDALMKKTQSFYFQDEAVYKNRKQRNFGLAS